MDKNKQDILDNLDGLYAKRDKLHDQLKRSMTIQDLWPDAFKYGKCKSFARGKCDPWIMRCQQTAHRKNAFKELKIVFQSGLGAEKEFTVEEVPFMALPPDVQRAWKHNDELRLRQERMMSKRKKKHWDEVTRFKP